MRLIDADKLKNHYSWWKEGGCREKDAIIFDQIVDCQPTVDAVKVIRCRNCRHYVVEDAPGADNWCTCTGSAAHDAGFCDEAEEV